MKRCKPLQIYLTESEHQQLREGSARAGLPMATWLRYLGLAASIANKPETKPEQKETVK